MQNTPLANRKNIIFYGNVNAGKSALFNAVLGQEAAIVSAIEGTTTDPVTKAMELIGYGPVSLTDTAGMGDKTQAGELRVDRTKQMLPKADLILLVFDAKEITKAAYLGEIKLLEPYGVPILLVLTKAASLSEEQRGKLAELFPQAIWTDINRPASIDKLKHKIIETLNSAIDAEIGLLEGIIQPKSQLLLVCPIDSEAPKGRLILPQVQLIRACLDQQSICMVTQVSELAQTLKTMARIDLVVTDSQVFHEVAQIIPEHMPLTSFSILFARQKGDLKQLTGGLSAIGSLKDGSRVLIAEACTHNHSHEDIGRVKIPALLAKMTGNAALELEYYAGQGYPEQLHTYDLIIHCGGCMITPKAMKRRIAMAAKEGAPIINYGVFLAYAGGVLERSMAAIQQ